MDDNLPDQLTWLKFRALIISLGYRPAKNKRGAARAFILQSKHKTYKNLPAVFTCHQPHGKTPYPAGTLREYIKHLGLTHRQFMDVLNGLSGQEYVSEEEEDQFIRRTDGDGKIHSNCTRCLNHVASSVSEEEIQAAELAHQCPEAIST